MNKFKIDWFLVASTICLSLIGVITLYGGGETGHSLANKKLIYLLLGIIIMLLCAFFNYQRLGSYAPIIYVIGIFLLILTLIPFIGTKVKGAQSWIRFFGIGFQPTEFMKVAMAIILSKYLILKEKEVGDIKELIIPTLICVIPIILISLQPDLGSAVLLIPFLIVVLYIGGADTRVLFGLTFIGFFSLFIPMYLEYHKYILLDDIVEIIKNKNFPLANAIQTLSFDMWNYIKEDSDTLKNVSQSNYLYSAIKLIIKPENKVLFNSVFQEILDKNPNWIRDFFSHNLTMLISIVSVIVLYVISIVVYLLFKSRIAKFVMPSFLILAITLTSIYFIQKVVTLKSHQVVRVISFANPDKFQHGAGYQLRHSLITLGSGQINGKGFFQGNMTKGKKPYLPEWYNDFIFSVIGEQFGFIGICIVLILLFSIIIRGIIIALQAKDGYGSLLAASITTIFFLHIVINLGVTIGFLPVTGIPLIFLSSGGSNLVTSFFLVGILININAKRYIN